MDQLSFRAMLAETAYLSRNPTIPVMLDAMPPANRRYVSTDAALSAARAAADFADCLVRAAPHESDAVLRTTQGSVAESAAIRQLAPAIPKCVASGQTVKINRLALRGFIADGLWTAAVPAPEKK